MTDLQSTARRRGRPPRAVRAASREPAHEPARGEGLILGRNGEILARTQTQQGDPYEITADMREKGWDLQWNAVSVINNRDVVRQQVNTMYANGWRPVMASRFDGRFMPHGYEGAIEVGGLRLEERPMALSEQARNEDIRKAVQQTKDRDEALMGGKANVRNSMNNGIEMGGRYRGTGADLRMKIDPGLDVPVPQHELAGPGE